MSLLANIFKQKHTCFSCKKKILDGTETRVMLQSADGTKELIVCDDCVVVIEELFRKQGEVYAEKED